jgi:hypothetical protein
MSRGPVAFSNTIHQTTVSRIQQTCRTDGILMRPDKPLTTMEACHGDGAYIDWYELGTS